MVGFVWPREEVEPRLLVSSRRSGTWAPWRLVPLMHDLPDEDDEEWHGRAGTQLVWIGPADGIRIKAEGRRPDGLTLVLMHPRSRDDDALVRSPLARADTGMSVVARPAMSGGRVGGRRAVAQRWPRYNATIEQVHVHHTANSNDYAASDVPGPDPRDLPLPHPLPGLVRHRLQLPRRPVRRALGGPRRRRGPARARSPHAGLQRDVVRRSP